MKGLSGAEVGFTFALNFYQLYTEMNKREDNVAKIEQMKQVLQNGSDSVQFFVNTLNEFRTRLYEASQNKIDEELAIARQQLIGQQQEVSIMREQLELQLELWGKWATSNHQCNFISSNNYIISILFVSPYSYKFYRPVLAMIVKLY